MLTYKDIDTIPDSELSASDLHYKKIRSKSCNAYFGVRYNSKVLNKLKYIIIDDYINIAYTNQLYYRAEIEQNEDLS